MHVLDQKITDKYALYNGDSFEIIKTFPEGSMDFITFSPPFSSLYVYSNDPRDLSNTKDYQEFLQHFQFMMPELYRILRPGRLMAFHCMNLTTTLREDGFRGIVDLKNKQKLNWVKLAECGRIPTNCKYHNPRVMFDGLDWWLSVGIEYPEHEEIPTNEGIGIDLGIKELAVTSSGDFYKNINKTSQIKKLEKKKRRLQRKVSKKYELNKNGANYIKTNNINKIERQILKLNKRLTNIRDNYIHQITSEIIKRKPSFIVMEDLNVKGMMKNKYLSKSVQEQRFYEFKRQIEYKSAWNNIKFIQVDRWYPSSKTCCECGNIKEDLKLSDRIYKCSKCGNEIDRDFNASMNLKNYGKNVLKSIA